MLRDVLLHPFFQQLLHSWVDTGACAHVQKQACYYIICKGGLVQAVRFSLIYSCSCVSSEQVASFKH